MYVMFHLQTISIVRDEEDVIEAFVRHHAAYADVMHITLHRSRDGTRAILERLKREDLPLVLEEDESEHYAQSEVLTRLLHRAIDDGAEFVLPLDADEFLSSETVEGVLGALEKADRGRVMLLPWKTYVPLESDPPERLVQRRIRHRRVHENPGYAKPLIPSALARHPSAMIPMGAHELLLQGKPAPSITPGSLFLGHFPVRSEAQLRRKILQGWEAHERNPSKQPQENWHWKSLVERCRDPKPVEAKELTSIASRYASLDVSDPPLHQAPLGAVEAWYGAARMLAQHTFALRGVTDEDTAHTAAMLALAKRLGKTLPHGDARIDTALKALKTDAAKPLRESVDMLDIPLLCDGCQMMAQTDDVLSYLYAPYLYFLDRGRSATLGVCYTPHSLVSFMVRTVSSLLEDMGVADGIRSPGIQIRDVACGTGVLIREAVRQGATGNLLGIDILKPALEILSLCGPELGVLHASALEHGIPLEPEAVPVLFSNPPYHQYAAPVTLTPETKATLKHYVEPLAAEGIDPHPLRDEYVRFIALLHAFLQGHERGVAAMALRSSFLASYEHRWMRKALLQDFRSIYVLDLGGDYADRHEHPDDESVYPGVEIGTCVLFLVRSTQGRKGLFHACLRGERQMKRRALMEAEICWSELPNSHPHTLFRSRPATRLWRSFLPW
jgi:hypothetical protein